MNQKKFLYYLNVEQTDKSIVRYGIYQSGSRIYIKTNQGYEHLMHASSKSIEDEIRIVFKGKVLN